MYIISQGRHLHCNSMDSDTTVPVHLEKFQDWIHCICVVTFDLELGQSMEVRHFHFHCNLTPGRDKLIFSVIFLL